MLLREKIKKNSKVFNRNRILIAVGIFLILLSLYSIRTWIVSKTDASPPLVEETIINSTETPSEVKVTIAPNIYKVPADQPRIIRIPSINIESYIQKVGIDQNQNIAVPSNIHFAGWFRDSKKPGEEGLSIIDGHYGNSDKQAIFYNLEKLKEAEIFSIEFGDGKKIEFKVKEIKKVSIQDAQVILFQKDPKISSQLNLITCGGKYLDEKKTYEDRVIIVSEQI